LDLAVANSYGDNVSILLGDGAGGFWRTTADYGVGRHPVSLTIIDLNGDRADDVATANADYGNDTPADVSILLGDGGGGFPAAARSYRAGSGPLALTIAGLNGDGNPDLVAAKPTVQGHFSVLLGNGGGTFEPTANYGVSAQLTDVVAGDFNSDGNPDLATTKYTSAGTIAVLLNDGDGKFSVLQRSSRP
jgi:hypothetical protein